MFYKLLEDGFLSFGPYVHSAEYMLLEGEHLNYTYPVDGWYWFDTEEEANTFFNINP
jgi:hypothetical protein